MDEKERDRVMVVGWGGRGWDGMGGIGWDGGGMGLGLWRG